MNWFFRRFPLLTILAVGGTPVFAAPLEISIPSSQPAPAGFVYQVTLPNSFCAAVNDAQSALVIGHKAMSGQQISVYKLDAGGNTTMALPFRIAMPKPDSLKSFEDYPISLLFHPTLPLLYVWRDIAGPALGTPEQNPVLKEFDHLLIYTINNGTLQLKEACARGPQFAYGLASGSLAFDSKAQKLFLPNLRVPKAPGSVPAVGYFRLDAQGTPMRVPGLAPDVKMTGPSAMGYPTGLGYAIGSDDAVMFGTHAGPATWELENRRAQIGWFPLPDIGTACTIVGNPKVQAIYMAAVGTGYAYRMEHVDGFLTLLPQRAAVGGAVFHSIPVFITRQNKVAIGGAKTVHLLKLDAEGRLTPNAEVCAVGDPSVRALTYSEKFDRLYVAVAEAE
jgi:hypothetical protein